ncbi:signal transduction histidine kinase [Paraburkholderia sp. GAS199]|uniref:ATP-binding protein n=1 Tax=Paraburkholderia sp. GAS199 TaxID=3035126 RepID=UPI003D1A7CED
MTLSDFIEANLDGLIDDWADYARTVSPADSHLSEAQLRDSASSLLKGIAADMREAQTGAQQLKKSHGGRSGPDSAFNRIGRVHADDRLSHGFGINALVAEYRALRASVLRRWQLKAMLDAAAFQEMIRFNEAIDQMLAEAVQQFATNVEQTRELFAGMLAHDLRSPVGAILNTAYILLQDENLSPTSVRAGANLQRSATRVKEMIDDLFIFTRTRLGGTIPVEPTQQDVGSICHGAADEVRAAYPDARIDVRLAGELTGILDGARINQLIVNLLNNAVQHGAGDLRLEAAGDGAQIILSVSNGGAPIPASAIPTIFDPLTRAGHSPVQKKPSSGIGLGLYICRCIARAHDGSIGIESDQNVTAFTVKIPRFLAPPR